MRSEELLEAQEIEKDVAIQKIRSIIKFYGLTQEDVLSVFADPKHGGRVTGIPEKSKIFDPFFDAW